MRYLRLWLEKRDVQEEKEWEGSKDQTGVREG